MDNLKIQKRTKMHHVITLVFCYFPFAWLVNLWVMRAVKMDCKNITKLIVPLLVETVVFVMATHKFNDMKRLEKLMWAISKTCPRAIAPNVINVKNLRRSLYIVRVLIAGSLLATLPWNGTMIGFVPLLFLTGYIWITVTLQDTYYMVVYYEMFGKYGTKDGDS